MALPPAWAVMSCIGDDLHPIHFAMAASLSARIAVTRLRQGSPFFTAQHGRAAQIAATQPLCAVLIRLQTPQRRQPDAQSLPSTGKNNTVEGHVTAIAKHRISLDPTARTPDFKRGKTATALCTLRRSRFDRADASISSNPSARITIQKGHMNLPSSEWVGQTTFESSLAKAIRKRVRS